MARMRRWLGWGLLLLLAATVYWSQRVSEPATATLPIEGSSGETTSLDTEPSRAMESATAAERPLVAREAGLETCPFPKGGDRLQLWIRDEEGQAIEGVEARLRESDTQEEPSTSSGMSDAQGQITLTRTLAGSCWVDLRKRGYGPRTLGPISMPGTYSVTLARGYRLELQFVQAPYRIRDNLENLPVELADYDHGWRIRSRTDTAGRVWFEDIAEGSYFVSIDTRAPVMPFSTRIRHRRELGPQQLEISSGALIDAWVVDALDGSPIANARIQVHPRPLESPHTPRTDAAGYARFAEDQSQGSGGTVSIHAAGYQSLVTRVPLLVHTAGVPTWKVELTREPAPSNTAATPSARLMVQVLRSDGTIQAHPRVSLVDSANYTQSVLLGNQDGRCAWTELRPGDYAVRLLNGDAVASRFSIGAGEELRLTVVDDFDRVLRGMVLGEDGTPLAEVRIEARIANAPLSSFLTYTHSNRQGSFELRGLPARGALWIDARVPSQQPWRSQRVTWDGPASDWQMVLPRLPWCELELRKPDGSLHAHTALRLLPAGYGPYERAAQWDPSVPVIGFIRSDEWGRVRFPWPSDTAMEVRSWVDDVSCSGEPLSSTPLVWSADRLFHRLVFP